MDKKEREMLQEFYSQLAGEVISQSSVFEDETSASEGLLECYGDVLVQAAEISGVNSARYSKRKAQVDGYVYEGDETISLVSCRYGTGKKLFTVKSETVTQDFERLENFFTEAPKLIKNDSIEEATEAFDLANLIASRKFQTVELMLFTNGLVEVEMPETKMIEDTEFRYSVWDIKKVFEIESSAKKRKEIAVDVLELNDGKPIYLLASKMPMRILNKADDDNLQYSGGYSTYTGTISGRLLSKIYEKYEARLLEKNVRAFLQVKGNVNRGIQKTIFTYPEMFLAYNNGISCTARRVESAEVGNQLFSISKINDLQIVNGGQTTASIYHACRKNPSLLENIEVQIKLTVLDRNDEDYLGNVVHYIAQYANTQNRVQFADFSANDSFYKTIEELARKNWAPSETGGEKYTLWYFERYRGQYEDERLRSSPLVFDARYPKKQKFTKIDLARVENLWDLYPHEAAKGGQNSFRFFTVRLKERGKYQPDETYYKNLISKLILYKTIKEIVKGNKDEIHAYWNVIIDYTFSLLSYLSAQRINLEKIWIEQTVSNELRDVIRRVSLLVKNELIAEAGGANVQQYAKKPQFWDHLKNTNFDFISKGIKIPADYLIDLSRRPKTEQKQNIETASEDEKKLIDKVKLVSSGFWWDLCKWGKSTGSLEKWQYGICASLGKIAGRGGTPSHKQAIQAVKIVKVASSKGFYCEPHAQELAEIDMN